MHPCRRCGVKILRVSYITLGDAGSPPPKKNTFDDNWSSILKAGWHRDTCSVVLLGFRCSVTSMGSLYLYLHFNLHLLGIVC